MINKKNLLVWKLNSNVRGLTSYCGLKNYSWCFYSFIFWGLDKNVNWECICMFFNTIIYFYRHASNFYWNNEYNKNIENILFS